MFRIIVAIICCLASSAALADGLFIVTDDDLPEARVDGHRIAFTRNGAFVVGKDERWLFDGGLVYATPGWQQWGTQIRRAAPEDAWSMDGPAPGALTFHGTLFDTNREKRFSFVERVMLIPGGLHFEYELTSPAKTKLLGAGLAFHFPVRETTKARVACWPGFDILGLPEKQQRPVVGTMSARGVQVHAQGLSCMSAMGPGIMAWEMYDDRAWQLNTYRMVGWDAAATAKLAGGKTATFSFDLLLGSAANPTVGEGPFAAGLDTYGRFSLTSGADKALEGGLLASVGKKQEWVDATAPRGILAAKAQVLEATGTAPAIAQASPWRATLVRDDQGFTVTYQAPKTAIDAAAAKAPAKPSQAASQDLLLAYAVPVTRMVSPPEVTNAPARAEADPPVDAANPIESRVRLAYRGDIVVELASASPWQVVEMTVGRTKCFVLTTGLADIDTERCRKVKIECRRVITKTGELKP